MDSIDQIRQNMSEVDMLLNYASQNANDVQKYQLFNKTAVVLLSTKFEVFLEDFIDEHSRKILNGHTNTSLPTDLKNSYVDSTFAKVSDISDRRKKIQYMRLLMKLFNSNEETISTLSPIRPSLKFAFGKHGQKEIEKMFERHGLKNFIKSVDAQNALRMMNSLFSIRNNVIHEDASPALTHQTIQDHRDNIMNFVDLIEKELLANHFAYYNH